MEINGVVKGHHSGLSPCAFIGLVVLVVRAGPILRYTAAAVICLYCRLPFHVARALAVQAMKRDVNVHYNLFVP
jgi:hypothetical protein